MFILFLFFFFKQKTAYEFHISDWSSDVCSSDLFGERNFRTDFLYQSEWQAWLKDGVLDRMDVAFSRDGAEKIYVQQRMRERSRELFDWLENGAHVYVCGDASNLARSEEHTSELQSLMRISYAVFCLQKKNKTTTTQHRQNISSDHQ